MKNEGLRPDQSGLAAIVSALLPGAHVVSTRFLRRVIRVLYDVPRGSRIPHDHCLFVPPQQLHMQESLLLPYASANGVIFIAVPETHAARSTMELHQELQRRLYHVVIDRELATHAPFGFENARNLFPPTSIAEIECVLQTQNRCLPSTDCHAIFREFVAFFAELRLASRGEEKIFFPGIADPDLLWQWLLQQVALADLGASVRLPNSQGENSLVVPSENLIEGNTTASIPTAQVGAPNGNDVAAAIAEFARGNPVLAQTYLIHLIQRLSQPLHLSQAEKEAWFRAILPVLEPACRGFWPGAARFLHELQKACLDVEKAVYTVEAFRYIASAGRSPWMRALHKQREINILRRLRAALRYLRQVPLAPMQLHTLKELLRQATEAGEQRVRQENRPVIEACLKQVGLVATMTAEIPEQRALIEELLDHLCARGFLTMSTVRDALARNRIKLDDLDGVREFFQGDKLLRANRCLAVNLDNIYRPGEIYLRGLHRLSSLAFGTAIGRILMLFLVLPFGIAYVAMEGLNHFIGAMTGLARLLDRTLTHSPSTLALDCSILTRPATIVVFGLFLFLLIHSACARNHATRWAKYLVLTIPGMVYHSRLLRLLLNDALVKILSRYVITPGVAGCATLVALRILKYDWETTLCLASLVTAVTALLLQTSLGQMVEERTDEVLGRIWRVVSVNFFVGVFLLIFDIFQTILEYMERGMYAVDEWLRFREGDKYSLFIFKYLFSLFWSVFTYLFRFGWNLLVEPQINPIKHFPVVTVSHKLLLPLIPSLAASFGISGATMGMIIFGIPGIFGFLVWEWKENWRLYRANCSKKIRPSAVGSHGEKIRALLRPGFHSGVVPKTFCKMQKAILAENGHACARCQHTLEHVCEAIQKFVERHLIAFLKLSRRWGGLPIHCTHVTLASHMIRIHFTLRQAAQPLVLLLEEREGWLIGSIENPGWSQLISRKQLDAWRDVISFFYSLCGIDFTREQLVDRLGVPSSRIDFSPTGPVILPQQDGTEIRIDQTDSGCFQASSAMTLYPDGIIPAHHLLFSELALAWSDWLARCASDHSGNEPSSPLFRDYLVI